MSDTTQPRANNTTKPDLSFLAPPEQPGQLGMLGTYQVIKLLGYGGMGLVLHAHDPRLQRDVALKVMNAKFAADPTSRQRFLREARATAAVKHDHIVTIYDVNEANGVPYIAMERLLGLNLERYLKQLAKPMSVSHIQRIAREAAAGLQAAHDKGLVHRDIKLSNIFLEKEGGRVKLVDFGLAILPDSDHRVSSTGLIIGTPEFMSPEQARGEVVDHRSDLFSLGVVLYRLATGVQPFRGATAIAVIMAISTDTPAPAITLNPAIPRGLSALIDRLLAKHPKDRPQQAREVIAALSGTTSSPALPAICVAPVPKSTLPVPDLWNFTPAVLPDGTDPCAPPAPPLTNQYTPTPSQYPTTFPSPYPSTSTNAYTVPTVVVPPPPVAMPTPVPPPPPPPAVGSGWGELEDERPSRRSERPSRRDEDDRPSRRRAADDEDDHPSRRRDRDEDEDDEPAPQKATGSKGSATASMVLGIIACVFLLFSCCGGQYLSTLLSVIGLICAFVGLKGSKQRTAGFVLNSLALVPAVLATVSMVMGFGLFGLRMGSLANNLPQGGGGGGFGGGLNNGGNGGGEQPPAGENGTVEIKFGDYDQIKDVPLELFFDGELDAKFHPDHIRWGEHKYTRTLPVGEHALEVKISGQSVHTSKVTVKPPAQGVTFVTVKGIERPDATGTLEVKWTGEALFYRTTNTQAWNDNLEVRVDGKLADWKLYLYDHTYNIALSPGKHTIKLTKNGVDCFEKEVEVKKAKDGKSFLTLDRTDMFQQTVTITNTNPAKPGQLVQVFVNDRLVGDYPTGVRSHSVLVLIGQSKIEVIQKKPSEVVFARWPAVDVTKEKPVKLEIK